MASPQNAELTESKSFGDAIQLNLPKIVFYGNHRTSLACESGLLALIVRKFNYTYSTIFLI